MDKIAKITMKSPKIAQVLIHRIETAIATIEYQATELTRKITGTTSRMVTIKPKIVIPIIMGIEIEATKLREMAIKM